MKIKDYITSKLKSANPAILYDDEVITYDEVFRKASALSTKIKDICHDRCNIAILLPNIPEYVFAYFGVLLSDNIVVPIYQIMAGFGLMVGVGCSVATSIHMSQNNIKVARLNVTQAILIASLIVAIFALAVILSPNTAGKLLGASPTLLPQVSDYLVWIMPSFVLQMWSMIGLFTIRIDGSPKYAMWCNIIPATLNAILDWVFIFPLNMGVKGAAIATGISIIFGGIIYESNRNNP